MTFGNVLSNMGLGQKQIIDRYTDFVSPGSDQHLYYTYEPPHASNSHIAVTKHGHGGSHKNDAAMSALTLLAFLFFLHILQQCLKDQMNTATPIMIMSTKREEDQDIAKTTVNSDKFGAIEINKKNPLSKATSDSETDDGLTKIETAEHVPQSGIRKKVFHNN